ncbi:thiol-disulfide oxidoreductase DCC family protein [Mucilaginibacter myungsuensis]|uniref:DUF393 domain-containing protein n=1 Tax=Mucilaginibacter myungsuensis TaxID=649104 RepID=A0A929KZR4_9SPHI|nr:DUF393 domain-containing protein [Mucilaginibacter myungsuensis]MBE9664704.1 DUF393 domain-containing protein [Mucilaginibacter myungsuensis]MDN3601439.1 DUF393 domain-containing protein [Mucilaginibacter myungsuensis]
MKTLTGYTILYDAECPMCDLYSRAMVATGMLDDGGRATYQQMPEAACPLVDRQRAMNEIALVNTETGEVQYGIRSLFKVIGNSFPVFNPLFGFAPFVWLMSKVYAFISYNRRVIIPAAVHDGDLQPTFRLSYRLIYLLFTSLSVGFILTKYAALLTEIVPIGGAYREYLICSGQVFFQGIIISLYRPVKRWAYLGNMMTISFAGALLLLPMLLIAKFISIPVTISLLYFMAVAGLMFLEHIRRSKLLGLGWLLTATWVAYRLGLLVLILN